MSEDRVRHLQNEEFEHYLDRFCQHIEIRDRKVFWKTFKQCFTGKEAVNVWKYLFHFINRDSAIAVGNQFIDQGILELVVNLKPSYGKTTLKDKHTALYRLNSNHTLVQKVLKKKNRRASRVSRRKSQKFHLKGRRRSLRRAAVTKQNPASPDAKFSTYFSDNNRIPAQSSPSSYEDDPLADKDDPPPTQLPPRYPTTQDNEPTNFGALSYNQIGYIGGIGGFASSPLSYADEEDFLWERTAPHYADSDQELENGDSLIGQTNNDFENDIEENNNTTNFSDNKKFNNSEETEDTFVASSQNELEQECSDSFELRPRASSNTSTSSTHSIGRMTNEELVARLRTFSSVSSLLTDPYIRNRFKKYCKKQFSDENIVFWEEVETYKKLDPDEQSVFAHKIFNTFISRKAIFSLNMIDDIRDECEANLDTPNKHLFDNAQRATELNLKDSYDGWLMNLSSKIQSKYIK
eukprot:gb/GECH01001018.1/.p1 GENE.gb/GECH01001018.1/~~gb/GECH01001018.1/.p1  ORF type:complete len:464 (+),score=109.34 gb/GECH01001018.1/:1-1392(+)